MSHPPAPARRETARDAPASPPGAVLIYVAGLVQGLMLVGPAAAGPVLRPAIGDARYGAIFLPLVAGAILGALTAPAIEGRRGAKGTLGLGFIINVLGGVVLAAAELVLDQGTLTFLLLCVACGLIGIGFGLSIAALNVLAIRHFPGRSAAAVATMHMTLGIGSVVGPVAIGLLTGWGGSGIFGDGPWWLVPLAAAGAALVVLVLLGGAGRGARPAQSTRMQFRNLPARLLVYAAIALVYGGIEGLFINWTAIYVREDLSGSDFVAGVGLALFFGVMALGRLLFAFASLRRPLLFVLVASPLLASGTFLLMAAAGSPGVALLAAALAGGLFAPFFVYLLSLAALEFSDRETTVSGLMMAALMAGSGISALIVGLLRGGDIGLEAIFFASAVLSVLVAVAVVPLRPGSRTA